MSRVLVMGIYLSERENTAAHLMAEFGSSSRHNVTQRWASIGAVPRDAAIAANTVLEVKTPTPKFALLNAMLKQVEWLDQYDYLVIADDDIKVQAGFLDAYLAEVERYDLALAQPARTWNSYIDHHFVGQLLGVRARRTRFVEIGPLFTIRRDAYPALLPFDERTPMGWGYDFAWPCVMERLRKRMGIVDVTAVDHSLRKPASGYSHAEATAAMERYLAATPHLTHHDAFRIVESYAIEDMA